jgi:hypothetical protein
VYWAAREHLYAFLAIRRAPRLRPDAVQAKAHDAEHYSGKHAEPAHMRCIHDSLPA